MAERPPGPRKVLLLRRDPEVFLRLARKYGDVVSFRVGPREVFLVSRPNLIAQILRDHYATQEKDWGPRKGSTVFGNGLMTSEGSEHRTQRAMFSRIFARPVIEAKKPVIASIVDEWMGRQRDGAEIDLLHEMSMLTGEVATRILFGCSLDHVSVQEATLAAGLAFRRWMFPYANYIRFRQKRGTAIPDLVDQVRRLGTPEGLLSPLLAGDESANPQITTFLIAGNEAMRIALIWSWMQLAAHPEARERLAEDDSFAEPVLLESMRLHPPQWMIGRRTTVQYPFDGYEVPSGALVLMSPYVVHRDPRFFKEPLRFMPERWEQPVDRTAYFPFGAGPRRCIGESFALTVGTMILSSIARHWTFEFTPLDFSYDARLTLPPRRSRARIRRVRVAAL